MAGLKDSQHLILSLKEIQVATNNFETCIGNGGYGRVHKGKLFIAGKHTMVAVKRLHENLGQGLKEFLTEIQLLTGQEHPNVVSLLGFCDEGKDNIIVYEYAEHGSLDRYIRPCDTTYCLTWLERLKICVDVACGLDHLHNHVGKHQSIIHRDIKSSNILLDVNWVAKVSDLGKFLNSMYQSGYQLAIEAAPRDIHPIAIPVHQVAEFMEINSVEEEPTDTQNSCESNTLVVQDIGVHDLQGDELEEATDNFENKSKTKEGLFGKGYPG